MTKIMMRRPGFYHLPKAHEHVRRQNCRNSYIPSNIIRKENGGFEVQLAVPGIQKETIQLFLEDDVLNVVAKNEERKKELNYRLKQFDYANFKKRFELPEQIDRETITANYENGLLTITLNVKQEDKTRLYRKIEIH